MINFNYYNKNITVPILLSPIGDEEINNKEIKIEWEEITESNTFIEIYYTSQFYGLYNSEWVSIAVVPASLSSYIWKRSNLVSSRNARLAIRLMDSSGERSNICLSNKLIINNYLINPPVLLSPISSGKYSAYIPFKFVPYTTFRGHYVILYKSDSLEIPWTVLVNNLSLKKEIYNYDAEGLLAANDYEFQIYVTDGDISSFPVTVSNIQIKNNLLFTIDTEAPKGTISILNNNQYINNEDIILKLNYYDETTEVDRLKVIERDIETMEILSERDYSIRNVLFYTLTGGDGERLLQVQYQDSAGNIEEQINKIFFRPYIDYELEISVVYIDKENEENDIWVAYNDADNSLYKNKNLIATLNLECSAMIMYRSVLFLALITAENKGAIYRIFKNEKSLVFEIDEENSVINSFKMFKDILFIGCENGSLYQYDGSSFDKIVSFGNPIKTIGADDFSLFVGLKNSSILKILNIDGSEYSIQDYEMDY